VSGGPSGQLGIVELVDVCARMQARNLALFELLGGWIVDTADPDLQRLFTQAAHRHAWHADLWAARMPLIAGVVPDESVAVHQGAGAPADRVRWYRDALDDLTSELDALLARVDGLLDPSTTRTAELVQHDLTQLRDQLGGRRIGR